MNGFDRGAWLGQVPLATATEGSRADLLTALVRQAERYHLASLQDQSLMIAARHNAYASGIIGVVSEQSTDEEVESLTGLSLKDLRKEIYQVQDRLEGEALKLLPKDVVSPKSPWLGQATLVMNHSGWDPGHGPIRTYNPFAEPPFFGLWYAFTPDGDMIDSGRVGPFARVEAAVQAARKEAAGAGVLEIGQDGWIRVVDKNGYSVGPVSG